MPDASPGLAERVEVAILSLVLAIATILVMLQPLLTSQFVRALVTAVNAEDLTGIGSEATLQAAESVRLFVVDADAPQLPVEISGEAAFDESATSHLEDVRGVVVPARWAALLFGLAAAVWVAIRARSHPGPGLIGRALRIAAWLLTAGAALCGIAGAVDFEGLFARFHGVFFAPGTWTFPPSALLIRVFPTPFWICAGATWAVLVLISAGIMFTIGRRLRFTGGTYGV
ncbi:MAG: DUF1461 domain-containing protein [Coriobacteriia bacterium]|nr:DUF1461 domain-containing protein [Coriobacteriia bacterium]